MTTTLKPAHSTSAEQAASWDVPAVEIATKVSTLVRTFGHAHTEVWCATRWDRFKEIVRDLRAQA